MLALLAYELGVHAESGLRVECVLGHIVSQCGAFQFCGASVVRHLPGAGVRNSCKIYNRFGWARPALSCNQAS